jgi:Skp family chaperone for outer membrane proteins
MKTLLKLSAAAALLAATAAPAFAAGTILTIDFGRVYSESAAAKSGVSQIQNKYNPIAQQRRAAFQSALQAYESLRNQLQAIKAPAKPTPAQLSSFQQAGERAQAAQDQLGQLEQETQQVGGYVQQQILEKVIPIAEQIRNDRKAEVVMSKGTLVASDPADDITTQVLQRLDATFTTPAIVPPQQPAAAAQPAAPAANPTQGR